MLRINSTLCLVACCWLWLSVGSCINNQSNVVVGWPLLVFTIVTLGDRQFRDPIREIRNQVWHALQEMDGNDTTFNNKVSKQVNHNQEVIIIIK